MDWRFECEIWFQISASLTVVGVYDKAGAGVMIMLLLLWTSSEWGGRRRRRWRWGGRSVSAVRRRRFRGGEQWRRQRGVQLVGREWRLWSVSQSLSAVQWLCLACINYALTVRWGYPTRVCVQAPQIMDVEELCQRIEEEWETLSTSKWLTTWSMNGAKWLTRSRLRTFWTFNRNITAFVDILIKMF